MADDFTVLESWVCQPYEFIHGAGIFTRDLQASLSYNGSSSTNTTTPDSSLPHTPTGSLPALTYSPFDNVTTQKQLQLPVGPPKKITKRKSRASKRSPTKYFTADPANFREMVQQITGFQANVIKPEPKRMMIPQSSSMLSTTSLLEINEMSPFMLDDQVLLPQPTQQQHKDCLFELYSVGKNEFSSFGKDCFSSSSSSSSFYPTLESWNGIIM